MLSASRPLDASNAFFCTTFDGPEIGCSVSLPSTGAFNVQTTLLLSRTHFSTFIRISIPLRICIFAHALPNVHKYRYTVCMHIYVFLSPHEYVEGRRLCFAYPSRGASPLWLCYTNRCVSFVNPYMFPFEVLTLAFPLYLASIPATHELHALCFPSPPPRDWLSPLFGQASRKRNCGCSSPRFPTKESKFVCGLAPLSTAKRRGTQFGRGETAYSRSVHAQTAGFVA